ncbi:Probable galacturonosyltransferase-like 7 [Linum grandiflorum]
MFSRNVAPIERWGNQHGLGRDNVRGSCRELNLGSVSLLHWSGSGTPWNKLDSLFISSLFISFMLLVQ